MTLQADLIAANKEFSAKQSAMAELLKDLDSLAGTKASDRASEIKQANDELSDLGEKRDALDAQVNEIERARAAVKAGQRPVNRQVQPEMGDESDEDEETYTKGAKSVGELIKQTIEGHPGLKSARQGLYGYRGDLGTLAIKTLITSADLTPLEDRRTGVIPSAQEERTTADLMLQGTTTAQKLTYFEETTFTNAAVETAEADVKQESALDFTLREDNVRKIATWVPVTDEMLADVPTFESYLRARLGFMVKQREELQLLQGAGTGVTIQGILNRTDVGTVTGYGESTLDSLYHGITKVRVDSFSEPTAFVMHPNDWSNVRLSKDGNNNYLLGPATQEGPSRVWGLEVRITTNIPENTALVGAFRPHAQIFRRSGVEIAISTEHDTFFIYNKVAVRAEERLALAVYRPKAFCKIEAIVLGS